MEIFTDHIFLCHRVGPGVRPVNADRADAEWRNECIESLPGASQGDFPGQVKGGRMDALHLNKVQYVLTFWPNSLTVTVESPLGSLHPPTQHRHTTPLLLGPRLGPAVLFISKAMPINLYFWT